MARSATETRSRILTAAGNLFSSHGYCGSSLDDIVTAAGITKGAFYHYFKSKEEVCLALLDQAIAQTSHLMDSPSTNPLEALRTWARRLVDPQESQIGNAFRLVLRLTGDLPLFADPIPDKIRRFWSEQAACLEILIRACPSLNPACKDARQAALLILSAFAGSLRLGQIRLTDLEPDQLLETVLKLVVQ